MASKQWPQSRLEHQALHTMSDPNPTSRLPHFHFHQLCAGILTARAGPHHDEAQWPLLEHFNQGCSALHRSWELRTWDVAAVETLLQLRYPQALVVFYQYPTLFVQGKIGFDGLFLQLRLR